jgi:uncharacterized RDD family membrane protein YckC
MSQLTINTTQNVNINFTAASVGHRMLGSLIDYLVKFAYCFLVWYVFFYWIELDDRLSGMDLWSKRALEIILFFPVIIYSLVLESLWEGQTIGKKLMKIKVVKLDGYQASFGDYFMRWIFRLIENNIGILFLCIIGIVSMASSEKIQRLGDMVAGTAVISLKNDINISSTILENIGDNYVPIYPSVIKLSDNDIRIIKDSFQLARKKGDHETVRKLCGKIEKVAGIKNQSGNDADFIKTVLKDYNFYTQNM